MTTLADFVLTGKPNGDRRMNTLAINPRTRGYIGEAVRSARLVRITQQQAADPALPLNPVRIDRLSEMTHDRDWNLSRAIEIHGDEAEVTELYNKLLAER